MQNQLTFDRGVAEELVGKMIQAADRWGKLPIKQRVRAVRQLRRVIAERSDDIAHAISDECHRPVIETITQEILPTLEMARYCEKMFPRWLRIKRIRYGRPGFFRKTNLCFYEPIGPVALVTPANFPFSLAMMSLIYIMLAGNTVIIKLSEKSTTVAPLISQILAKAEISTQAANVLLGAADAAKWLINHPSIQKIFFFGKRSNGEEVISTCDRIQKPCVAEMGGGTTAIVCDDANLDVAVKGVAWSASYANGQSCLGTHRVVVETAIAEKFIQLVKNNLEKLQHKQLTSTNANQQYTFSNEEIIHLQQLIDDARLKGAKLVCGGETTPAADDRLTFNPVLLTDAKPAMRSWCEEVFGPLIVVMEVENVESALKDTFGNNLPLGISIWSRNIHRARSIASSLPSRMIWINDTSFGLPCLPWGGRDNTGKGMLFSEFSLHEVAHIRWISVHPHRLNQAKSWWYPYTSLKQALFRFAARKFFK